MSGIPQRKAVTKKSITFESKDGVQAFKDLISWMERELWEVAIDGVIPKQEKECFSLLVYYHKRKEFKYTKRL